MSHKLYHLAAMIMALSLRMQPCSAQVLLDPATQKQFVNPLPIPSVLDVRSGGTYTITVSQFMQDLGLTDPLTGTPLLTKVWGYNGSYPGPTILAKSGVPVNFYFPNNLVDDNGNPLPHLLPIDTSVHWAFFGVANYQQRGVPIVTHLHGGQTEAASDGGPLQWYTPNFTFKGPLFEKGQPGVPFTYSNAQEAATIWYHDHALGITRINVYAGLAGFYVVTDNNEAQLQATNKLPAAPYDIGLAIQDRMFTSDGQLYYPSQPPIAGAPNPSVQPEFFGNFILVNGKAWPVLDVEPRPYRFRMLDGSDSRMYDLYLSNNASFIQVGGDLGLLPAPVTQQHLFIAGGERKDVIIDFTGQMGQTIILRNNAKAPFPRGITPDPKTNGSIMAFRVSKPLNTAIPVAQIPNNLRPPLIPLQTNLAARQLILFEGLDNYGRLETRLGTPQLGGLHFESPITENPGLHSTEIWELYNTTGDAHPIHLHMVKMQLLNRQKFSANVNLTTGVTTGITLQGNPRAAGPDEKGWKDTYVMNPGEVTRIITTFDIPGFAVWHCHILSHEDHDMMRPYFIGPMLAAPIVTASIAANKKDVSIAEKYQLFTYPNPFTSEVTVQFQLPTTSNVIVNVYDEKGSLIRKVFEGPKLSGLNKFTLNGATWSNGNYFVEVLVNNERMTRQLSLLK